jgi:hypothetical protein
MQYFPYTHKNIKNQGQIFNWLSKFYSLRLKVNENIRSVLAIYYFLYYSSPACKRLGSLAILGGLLGLSKKLGWSDCFTENAFQAFGYEERAFFPYNLDQDANC